MLETLRQSQYCPYQYQRVQALEPENHSRSVVFCKWLLHILNRNKDFTKLILNTDEATNTRNGVKYFRNNDIWTLSVTREFSFFTLLPS